MFNLEIGRFIAATNTSVTGGGTEAVRELPPCVSGELIETRLEAAAASLKPEARRKFGFPALKRRA